MITQAQYDAVLKDVYIGMIRNQMKDQTVIYDRFKKVSKGFTSEGRQVVFPILIGWPQGLGARADGGQLPRIGQSEYVDCNVKICHLYGRVGWTGPAERASTSTTGAFAPVMSSEMKNQVDAFMRDFNRMVCRGTGVGVAATVASNITAADTTVTVDSTVDIFEGAYYEVWTGAGIGTGTKGETVQVNQVLTDTTFSVEGAFINSYVAASGITFIREGNKENETVGISGIVDDGSNLVTYQGVSRTSYRLWRSYVDDPGTNTVLTIDDLRSNKNRAAKAGRNPVIYSSYEMQAAYLKLCQEQNITMNTMKFDKGFVKETLTFDHRPWFADEQYAAGQIDMVDESEMAFYQQREPDWLSPAGSTKIPVSGFDMTESILCADLQMGSSRNNTSVSMRHRVSS